MCVLQIAGQSGALAPIFGAMASALRDADIAAQMDALIDHPVLLAAFEAVAGEDCSILDSAAGAIIAALTLTSCMGAPSESTHAGGLGSFLMRRVRTSSP